MKTPINSIDLNEDLMDNEIYVPNIKPLLDNISSPSSSSSTASSRPDSPITMNINNTTTTTTTTSSKSNNNNNSNKNNNNKTTQHNNILSIQSSSNYSHMMEQLEIFVEKIDQCPPSTRQIVWNELFTQSIDTIFKEKKPQHLENTIFLLNETNECTSKFTPYYESLIQNYTINYHGVELLYNAFMESQKKNVNLLSLISPENPNSSNNHSSSNNGDDISTLDLQIPSNLFLTSTIWSFTFPSVLQQLVLLLYWLPVLEKLPKKQKKAVWQTSQLIPNFQQQYHQKAPNFQRLIHQWMTSPTQHMNMITILFGAIGYVVSLGLVKNEFFYPESPVRVFESPIQESSPSSTSSKSKGKRSSKDIYDDEYSSDLSCSTSSSSSCSSSFDEFDPQSIKKLKNMINNGNGNHNGGNTHHTNLVNSNVPIYSPSQSPNKQSTPSISSTPHQINSSSNSSPATILFSYDFDSSDEDNDIDITEEIETIDDKINSNNKVVVNNVNNNSDLVNNNQNNNNNNNTSNTNNTENHKLKSKEILTLIKHQTDSDTIMTINNNNNNNNQSVSLLDALAMTASHFEELEGNVPMDSDHIKTIDENSMDDSNHEVIIEEISNNKSSSTQPLATTKSSLSSSSSTIQPLSKRLREKRRSFSGSNEINNNNNSNKANSSESEEVMSINNILCS